MRTSSLIIVLLSIAGALRAQHPLPCDGRFYYVAANGSQSSSLYRISKDSSQSEASVFSAITNDLGRLVTAMGYNVQDNYIYALDHESLELLRIDANGAVQNLGIPPNLDLSLEYFAGEVRPQGGALLVIGREAGGSDKALYTINLEPPYYAGFASIVSDEPVRITDLAFDPVFGSLFGFDDVKKRFVKVGIGGNVTSINYLPQPQIGTLGALFFDKWGHLYGMDENGEQDEKLLLFNKFNGTVRNAFAGPGGSLADGCSCPYRIALYKSIEPRYALPCSEVVVTYKFNNTAGISYGQVSLKDEFPAGFEIAAILNTPPGGGNISGIGTNNLDVTGLSVLLDTSAFAILLKTGGEGGEFAAQAVAFDFPAALGGEIFSDDPHTPLPGDATLLVVADSGEVVQSDNLYVCPEGAVTLAAAGNGLSYQWSNGAATSSITVSEPGIYTVTVSGNCGIYGDTVLVIQADAPSIDLGEDRSFPYNQASSLDYEMSAAGELTFQWQAPLGSLSCLNCPTPLVSLSESAVFRVTITDENGCTAGDEVRLSPAEEVSVFMPNVFSPNGDGINDVFYPQSAGALPVVSMRIFDRWGNQMFEKNDGSTNDAGWGWDGFSRGRPAATGVYGWEIRIGLPGGREKKYTGTVLLMAGRG